MASRREVAVRDPEESGHHGPARDLVVLAALLVLAGVSWGLAHLPLTGWSTPLAVGIAALKALLVILFFMHLWEHQGANRLVLAVAFFFVFLLGSLTVADVRTRLPITNPPSSSSAEPYFGPQPLPTPGRAPNLAPEAQPHAR